MKRSKIIYPFCRRKPVKGNLFLTLLFLSIIACILVGCRKDSYTPEKKVDVLFTTNGLGDNSFNDNLFKGILEASKEFDFEVEYAFPSDLTEATSVMYNWIDSTNQKEELIIVLGQEYKALVESYHGSYNKKYILLIDAKADDYPNLISTEFSFYGAAFQAGVAARQLCLNDTAGIIAAMNITPVESGVHGFADGFSFAKGIYTEIKYIGTDYSAFKNIDKAAEIAEDMFKRTNIIFGVAGNANQGIFETLRKTKNVYSIGVDQDQSWLAPDKIIGSVVKQIDKVAYNTIRDFVQHKFHAGYFMFGLDSEFMSFRINPLFENRISKTASDCYNDALSAEKVFISSGQ